MNSGEIRREAKEILISKGYIAIGMILIYALLLFAFGLLEGIINDNNVVFILNLTSTILSVPLVFGLTIAYMKLVREEEIGILDFIGIGFSNFKKSIIIFIKIFLKIWLPIVITISIAILIFFMQLSAVAVEHGGVGVLGVFLGLPLYAGIVGIILLPLYINAIEKLLLYIFTSNIAYDEPGLTEGEAMERSRNLMEGNRKEYLKIWMPIIVWIIAYAFMASEVTSILLTGIFGIGCVVLGVYIAICHSIFYESTYKRKDIFYESIEEDKIE